ncbi:MAG TPA: alpha/beta hydrolase [Actinospica sp.]|nr:alpha/beta hydrolase [Actinospica sp.]
MTGSTVRTRDGRALRYAEHGDPSGKPVILMHGTPGSRLGPIPRASRLYPLGVRVIAYDRPGYGGSDRYPDRAVAHAAADVADLADELGLERFALVGRSGGGPHVLACAALLPDRVVRAAALASVAPYTLMGREQWLAGMSPGNRIEYAAAEAGREKLEALLSERGVLIRDDPESHLPFDSAELTRTDRAVMADFGIRRMLLDNYTEALRVDACGWIDDAISFVRAWGFDPAGITVPVLLWHGADDVHSPVAHTAWLGARIPSAKTVIQRGVGHFSTIEELLRTLSWLAA